MTDDQSLRRQLAKIAKKLVGHDTRLSIIERTAQAKFVSITDGSTTYYDNDGNPTVVVGKQPDGVYTTQDQNGPALLAPSAPLCASELGVLNITWDGLDQYGGAVWPSHFKHVEVHLDAFSDFEPVNETQVATFSNVKGGTVTLALAPGTWYTKLVAVNTSGVESAPSEEIDEIVLPIPDPGIQAYRQNEPPTGLGLDDFGSIWYDTNDGNKQYFWDGADWVSVSDTGIDESVNSYSVEYSVNSSESVAPTTGWSTSTPTRTPGTFIWTRTVITRNNGTSDTTSPALLTGNTGATGSPGTPAASIDLTATTQVLSTPAGGGATTPATATVTGAAVNTTITAWTYSVDGAAFSSSVPTGVSRTGNTVTVTGSTMTARTIAIKAADANGVADTLTVAKVADGAGGAAGAAGYTVLLTNESHTFAGSTTAALAGSTTSQVIAYKGAVQQSATIGTITGQVTGLTTNITNNGTTTAGFTVTVTTSLTQQSGTLSVPITVDGVAFTQVFAWAVARQGTAAPTVALTATTQVLASPSGGGATTPATAVVTGTATNTTITVYEYSVDGAAFSTAVPTGASRTGNVVTITGGTMTARTIAVRMADATGIADTLTVAKTFDGAAGGAGSNGAAGYTVMLTNESQTFAGSTANALAGSASSQVIAYKGAVQQSATIGTITGQVTGLTTAITNNSTTTAGFTVTVTTALTQQSGTLTVPVTVDGVAFTQIFSWAVSYTGATGAAASTVDLTVTSQALAVPAAGGATTPTTSTVTGTATNTTISTWDYSVDGAAFSTTAPTGVSRTSNVVTITGGTMTARTIAVRATGASGVTDTVTVAKIADGATGTAGSNGYTVLLTNEANVFPGSTTAALAGSTSSQVLAYLGTTLQSVTIGTITGQVTGLTTALTNNGTTAAGFTVTVTTSLTATSGELTIPITVNGVAFTKKFSWSVSRTGATGSTGVSVTAITPYYAQVTTGASAPAQPNTSTPSAPWVSTEPAYAANTELYRTEKVTFSDATFAYTTVFKSSSYDAANGARLGAVNDLKNLWGHPSNTALIDGGDVYANSIRAQSLLLMDVNNYLSDSGVVDNSASSWSLNSGSSIVVSTGTTNGYMILNATSASTNHYAGDATFWATEAGTEYQVTGEYAGIAGNVSTTNFVPALQVQNNSSVDVSYVTPIAAIPVTTSTAWTPFSFSATIPTNGAKFRWRPYINASTTNNKVWIRNVKIRRKNRGELIVDGTITGTQILGQSVEAKHMSANSIDAVSLRGDAVNGKTVTGATIRTAATGNRVELTPQGLKQYKMIGTSEAETLSIGDQNRFTGEIDATAMVIRDSMQMFGKNNFMSAGSKMTLAAGPGASSTAPTLSWVYDTGPNNPSGWFAWGAHSGPSATTADVVGIFFNNAEYRRGNATYWTFPQITAPDGSSVAEFKPHTMTRIARADTGAERVVMVGEDYNHYSNGYPEIWMRVYDDSSMNTIGTIAPILKYQVKVADFNWFVRWRLGRVVTGSTRHQFTLTSETTPFGGGVKNLYAIQYAWQNSDNVANFDTYYDLQASLYPNELLAGFVKGTRSALGIAGTGTNNIIVIMTNLRNFVYNADTSAYDPSSDFPVTYNQQDRAWSEGNVASNTHTAFISMNDGAGSDAKTYRYASNHKAADETWWARFIWRGEATKTYRTTMSSSASITYRKMAKLRVTMPSLPAPIAGVGAARDPNNDVYGWEYFIGVNPTEPARTAMWLQTVQPTMVANTALAVSSIDLGTYPVLNTSNPPSSNTFPAASPGTIENPSGTLVINGDGTIIASTITTPGSYTSVTLASGFVNVGGSHATASVRKIPGDMVSMKGLVSAGSTGLSADLPICTIPAGFRPAQYHRVAVQVISSGGGDPTGVLEIRTDGSVVLNSGPATAGNILALSLCFTYPLI